MCVTVADTVGVEQERGWCTPGAVGGHGTTVGVLAQRERQVMAGQGGRADDMDGQGRVADGPQVFVAGSSFVERAGQVHLGRNESTTTPVEIIVSYFNVPAGTDAVRIDEPDPGVCHF